MIEKARRALDLINEVLEDEETGERPDGTMGWGPDVTMVPKLEEARDLLAELVEP